VSGLIALARADELVIGGSRLRRNARRRSRA